MLNKTFPKDKKHETVQRGRRQIQDYSAAYAQAYHQMLKGMIAKKMRASVLSVGSFWYSAWVDAGQPDLDKLIAQSLSDEQKADLQKEETAYRQGKVLPVNQ